MSAITTQLAERLHDYFLECRDAYEAIAISIRSEFNDVRPEAELMFRLDLAAAEAKHQVFDSLCNSVDEIADLIMRSEDSTS